MNLWNDGRSGEAGCAAGNIVLGHLAEQGIEFRKVRGTTFESSDALWIGRVCASDSYLSAGVAHWANVAFNQHQDLTAKTAKNGLDLIYLFVTAKESPPVVNYWRVPGRVLDEILVRQGKNYEDAVYGMHIVQDGNRFRIGNTDVTAYHHSVPITNTLAGRLMAAFEKGREKGSLETSNAEHALKRQAVEAFDADGGERCFEVPISGGRTASFRLPVPVSDRDIERIKGWFDLMADILTAPKGQPERVPE